MISKERLEGLLRLKVPVSRIAEDLQVSRPLVYKAIADYNLHETRYSNISEPDIQHAVSSIKDKHPNAGEVMLQGHLRAQGIHVPRSKVRKAIHDLDPSVTSRKRPAIRRRVYSVPYPNYLWHLDGNHKFIRWRFVVHHCIDGLAALSRSVVAPQTISQKLFFHLSTKLFVSTVGHSEFAVTMEERMF